MDHFNPSSPLQGKSTSSIKKKIIATVLALLFLMAAVPLSFAAADPDSFLRVFVASLQNEAQINSASSESLQEAGVSLSAEAGIQQLSGSGSAIVDVAVGQSHSLAIKEDGTLWSWGSNSNGQLGLGNFNVVSAAIPLQVGDSNLWKSVSAGQSHSLGLKTDGTIWSWGSNFQGRLGLGDAVDRSAPTQIGSFDTWVEITSGNGHNFAIQDNGTLWAWGSTNNGQLGVDGVSGFALLDPAQVGHLNTWQSVEAGNGVSFGIQDDGTLWQWGVGIGGSATGWTPVQVGNSSTWIDVSAGTGHAIAVQADGTLWAWGNNWQGALGIGHTNPVPEPTQVGSATTWAQVSAGVDHSLGIQSDGTLWGWGGGFLGQTGIGDSSATLTPVQVGESNAWQSFYAGQFHSLAIQNDGSVWHWGMGGAVGARGVAGNGVANGDAVQDGRNNWMPWRIAASLAPTSNIDWANADDATVPNNGAVDVPLNTDVLTIHFDREMRTDSSSLGTIVLDNGASVDLSQASWTSGSHVGTGASVHPNSVLTVPLDLVAPGTLHTATVFGFLDAQLGARSINEMHSHTWTFTTYGEALQAPEGAFTKTLTLPEGTTIPSPSFTFNFTAQQVVLDDTTTPNISSRPSADFATLLTNQTITLNAADAITENGTTTITGSLDIAAILSNLSFPGGGVYVWNVSELSGSSNTVSPSHMSYDDTLFQIRAWVNRYGDLEYIAIHNLERGEGTEIIDLGKTEDGINFFNTYMRQTGTEDSPALEVSKEVSGDLANLDTLFNFTLTLEAHTLAPITNTPPATLPTTHFTARIVNAQGTVVDRAVTITPGANNTYTLTFQLRHNETLQVPTLPAGTTFTTTEAAHPEFSPAATITLGGTQLEADYQEDVNTVLITGSHIMRDTGSNSADFINDHFSAPHTGLVVTSNLPLALIVGVGLLLTVMLALRNRQRIERMPL